MSIVARRLLLRGFAGLACLLVLAMEPLALAAAGAPGTGPSGAPPPGGGPVEVPFARVIDGHTLEAWIDTHRVGIEVIGIDVPQGNTPCGREATAALRTLVKGGVRLEDDPALTTSPRKLRLYHAIARDGRLIGEELARAGVARANGQGNRRQQLADAERQAQADKRGCLWRQAAGGADAAGVVETSPALTMLGATADPGAVVQPQPAIKALAAATTAFPEGFSQEVVAAGLTNPTAFAFLPDGRILIAEKSGTVRVVRDGVPLPTPFIDIRDRVNDYWDRGLLGIAVDPDFVADPAKPYVYLLYTYENDPAQYDGTKTARLTRVTASGDTASPGSEAPLLGTMVGSSCKNFPPGADCLASDYFSHSVGNIKFAADETMFVTIGDSANFNAVDDDALRAQNLDLLSGKLLHVDRNGAGVPGNPFFSGNPADNRSKVWAYGMRNPYRFSLRPGSGVPYVGDVGWETWEEVDVAVAGANLGWPCYEGGVRQSGYEPKQTCQALYAGGPAAVRAPLVAYPHNGLSSAVTGGGFYTGTSYPARFRGAYFYGDYAQGFLRHLHVDADNALVGNIAGFAAAADGPVDVEQGPDQLLYYLAINTGELRRLRYTAPSSPVQYLSDLSWTAASNGYGPVERDMSNGEQAAGDGRTIALRGAAYPKGLGVHAASDVRYALTALNPACLTFRADVGVDDEVGADANGNRRGSVVFQVWADGTLLYDSGPVGGTAAARPVGVSLAGRSELALIVTAGGDGNAYDHADWADARLTCEDITPPSVGSVAPAGGATGVAPGATVTATFSEAMDAATLSPATVTLARQGTGTPVAAMVGYDGASRTVTLTPSAKLDANTAYAATIKGGPSGAKDLAGNPLAADKVWTFTTGSPPTAVIGSPSPTLSYKVGDVIAYAGSATDSSGNPIPASFAWTIVIHHCPGGDCHTHAFLSRAGATGSFTIPDHGDDSYFELALTATDDSTGQSDTKSVSIRPQTVPLTLATAPPGGQVVYGGTTYTAPVTFSSVVGSAHTISVPAPQTINGTAYGFAAWSDGGAQQHNITVGDRAATYTATLNSVLQYYPLASPVRLMDTRPGQRACQTPGIPLPGGAARTVVAVGCGGIPATARALVGNATVDNSAARAPAGYVTLYPDDAERPNVSNLNYVTGQVVPNAFTVGLGGDGGFKAYAYSGVHLIVDVTGYYAPPGGGLYYHPLARPVRLLDTRPDQPACQAPGRPLEGEAVSTVSARIDCTGIPGGAQVVVGNATVVNPADGGAGYVTLWPGGGPQPNVSNLNYTPGQTVPNAFTAGLGGDGTLAIYAYTSLDFVLDVTGYYSAEPSDKNGAGLLYAPLASPVRLLDTRAGQVACDAPGVPLDARATRVEPARVACSGAAVPGGARAVVGNATVVNPAGGGAGYVTLYPSGADRPTVSNLNYVPGQVVPNAFTVGLGAGDGAFAIYAYTSTDFVVDVSGYFAP